MRAKQKKSSFIEEARRRQIIDKAIETIADKGFNSATFAQIAKEAGVSTGVITYHFESKDDLIRQVITSLFIRVWEYVGPRVEAETAYSGKLRTYIEANFEYMARHRNNCTALVESLVGLSNAEDQRRVTVDAYNRIRRYLSWILEEGRRTGDFKVFAVKTLAQIIVGALEGIMIQWVLDEEQVDLAACSSDLLRMIETQTGPLEPA